MMNSKLDQAIQYDPSAAVKLLPLGCLESLRPAIETARNRVCQDVKLLDSGEPIADGDKPLDAGFIELPGKLIADSGAPGSLLGRIKGCSDRLRKDIDRLVLLGIGGSYMGARALFESLCLPYHNELERYERNETPRLYYEGENIDNDWVNGLLYLLRTRCRDVRDINQRWGTIVISKSGGTLETAIAFRLIRKAMEKYYGSESKYLQDFIVPVTGVENSNLAKVADHLRVKDRFPIPEGVGGRFSIFTAVGLLPAAVMGIDIDELLRGAADITTRFRNAPFGDNPVLDYVAVCHAFETDKTHPRTIRILSTWGKRLEAVGLWYDQLLSESLGKGNHGATPITIVNTRDLHSRGQQHQEGALDKLITNLIVESPANTSLSIPSFEDNLDNLNSLADRNLSQVLCAAIQGANEAYDQSKSPRPTADIKLPRLDAYSLGQFFQMMMLATVVEGRLLGINPYGQPGVEAYKNNMLRLLGLSRK